MSFELEAVLAPLRHEGPRRFAAWAGDLFEQAARGPGATLAVALAEQPDGARVRAGSLRLLQGGVGTGLIRHPGPSPAGWTCFLERCLLELVPALLPALPPAEQLPALVKVW